MNSPNWVRHLNKRILQKFASNPGGTIAHALRISSHDKQEKRTSPVSTRKTQSKFRLTGRQADIYHAALQHEITSKFQAKDKTHANHYARVFVIRNSQKV